MKGFFPVGISILFWSLIGSLRYFTEKNQVNSSSSLSSLTEQQFKQAASKVAVCLPAHNEAVVIKQTIASLQQLVPAKQIYVVSDGSTDHTADLARAAGCQVLELSPSRGKARAIESLLSHFSLLSRYQYILIADADTTFNQHFLRRALGLLAAEPRAAVVSAYTKTQWQPHLRLNKKMFFIAYRLRMYYLLQALLMYGQTWHRTNVNPVIPGFACLYRSAVLKKLTFAPPGIIIEDFTLAFQLHKYKLGTIAHHPSVYATTQDPDNLRDYYKQVQRWNIGLLQTIRHWKIWPSFFWLSLGTFILETFLFYLILLLLPLIILAFTFFPTILGEYQFTLAGILLALLLIDYLITLTIAWISRVDILATYGLFFILLRYVDALVLFTAIPKAFLKSSDGIWSSPARR